MADERKSTKTKEFIYPWAAHGPSGHVHTPHEFLQLSRHITMSPHHLVKNLNQHTSPRLYNKQLNLVSFLFHALFTLLIITYR